MRSVLARVLAWVVVIAALGWIAWYYRAQLPFAKPQEPQVPVLTPAQLTPATQVTALGRIWPRQGITRVGGPSRFAVVVGELLVERGDQVSAGQLIARLDSMAVEQAEVARAAAELAEAELEVERTEALHRDEIAAEADLDRARLRRDATAARLRRARAELALSQVRSPLDGRVLAVHTRAGERVGPEGIVELCDTSAMLAIAEVYETDITRVRIGQRAVARSPALPEGEVSGVVERIGLRVGQKQVLDTDPVADADARVVEVEILIDDPQAAADLINLRVEVVIDL